MAAISKHGRRHVAGFTLVELMVVLAVMALAATAVMLSLTPSDSAMRHEANRLSARIAAARDLAVVEGAPVSLWLSPSGYGFERRAGGAWQAVRGRGFETRNWPDDVRLDSAGGQRAARLIFDRMGTSVAPITIQLSSGPARAAIHVSAVGEVTREE